MKALFANVFVLLIFALGVAEVRPADIAVVISSDAKIYQEALEARLRLSAIRLPVSGH